MSLPRDKIRFELTAVVHEAGQLKLKHDVSPTVVSQQGCGVTMGPQIPSRVRRACFLSVFTDMYMFDPLLGPGLTVIAVMTIPTN